MPDGMRFTIVLGQRLPWPEMLANTLQTEALGLDGLYVVDHFFGRAYIEEPTHEAWTMLAALAPFTQRLRLGVMVTGNTYRNPAFLLKQAVTVDHISGGRVDFGVGAGWLEREHDAYGFEFPSARDRVDRFAEALEIWDRLQEPGYTDFSGKHYTLIDAPFEPKPVQQPRLPLLIGASGPRMLRLVARHADEWNMVATPEEGAAGNRRLDEACAAVGRDPATLARSVSPSINLLESLDAFASGVAAYRDAGFGHITFPWPRVPEEVPVLREAARSLVPGFRRLTDRPEGQTGEHESPPLSPVNTAPFDTLRDAVGALGVRERALLAYIVDRQGETCSGDAMREAFGLERLADLSRIAASIGAIFADHGLARPWTETQRGYLMTAETAAAIRGGIP